MTMHDLHTEEEKLSISLSSYLLGCWLEAKMLFGGTEEENQRIVLYDNFDHYAGLWAKNRKLPKGFLESYKKRLHETYKKDYISEVKEMKTVEEYLDGKAGVTKNDIIRFVNENYQPIKKKEERSEKRMGIRV